MELTFYEILQISSSATDQDIKKAYRKLSKLYHPDKNGNDTTSEEKFKRLSQAYSCLIDPKKRKQYDEQLNANKTFIREPAIGSFSYSSVIKSIFSAVGLIIVFILIFNVINAIRKA